MALTNRKQVTLYEEAKAGFSSLGQQMTIVFIGFIVMLLVTGGAPSGLVVALSFFLGTAFVAWKEQKRVFDLRSTKGKPSSDSQVMNTSSVTYLVRKGSNSSSTQSAEDSDEEEFQILPEKERVIIERPNLLESASEESVDEIASELQRLLEQFSQTAPNSTISERMAVFAKVLEEIERQPQLKQQLIEVLKLEGAEAWRRPIWRQSSKYPDISILFAALETYIDSST
jgi:hypothetical protein